jgi:hypothetical protein
METVIRNVGDIDARDRRALEHIVGHRLRENQQLVIGIVNLQIAPEAAPRGANGTPPLPDWCDVYSGLSDDDIADLEKAILSCADLSRPSE